MLKAGFALAATLLVAGCSVHEPALPTRDSLIWFKANQDSLAAASSQYLYQFDDRKQLYGQWQALSQSYGTAIRGVAINFEVDGNRVEAQYSTYIDTRSLSEQQKNQLTAKYDATPSTVSADQKVVTFRANGYWHPARTISSTEGYQQLNPPLPVTINDKTRGMNPLWVPIIVPAFPLILMYGCATGPCV